MNKNNWYNYSDPEMRLRAQLEGLIAERDAATSMERKKRVQIHIDNILRELKEIQEKKKNNY